jgi:MFS family permease
MAGSESVSTVGNWIAMQAIYALLIFKGGGGVGQSAGIYLSGLAPAMLLGPLAGWLCDRFDRRRLMIISELAAGCFVALMMITTRLEWIYACLVATSIAGTVMAPARGTVVRDVVAPADLTRANAFLHQLAGLTKIGAPLLGALVVSLISPRTALFLDVVSFVLSAAILTFMPALPARGAEASGLAAASGVPEEKVSMWQGLRSILRKAPQLRLLFPFMFVLALVLISYDITAAVYVRDVMRGSIAFKGMMASMVGLGAGGGAFGLMFIKGERNVARDCVIGLMLVTCLPAGITFGSWISVLPVARAAVMAGSLLGGLGISVANVQFAVMLQRLAPEGWLGRLSGAVGSVMTAGQVIGMFATPLLVPHVVSFGVYFGLSTLVLMLISLGTMLALHRAGAAGPVAANEVASGAD